MSVFSFGVDEDSLVFDIKFDTIESFFENTGKHFCGIFLDKYSTELEESVYVEDKDELFDYDGGEVESAKFDEMCEKYSAFLETNSEYVLVSFSVEYDTSWLLLKRADYDQLLKMSELEVANEE